VTYAGNTAEAVGYNTFTIPRGSKPLSLTLSDGSRVWLNVGSSLTYPTAFTGKERRVTITGEAYFEVAHNAAMPFRVQHDDITISVLGTHFNVNTYEDETAERITLLEGSVLVSKKNASKLLEPGQQASISHDEVNNIKVAGGVDLDEVMAWRDGKFRFGESMDIGTIMRQISRWYDVDIEYKGSVKQRFWGSISKSVNVSQVLKILEATGGVKFTVEGNKIIVTPAI
jgi:ferric-dicitrate binding protein FerR (iron transport regulator)